MQVIVPVRGVWEMESRKVSTQVRVAIGESHRSLTHDSGARLAALVSQVKQLGFHLFFSLLSLKNRNGKN